MRHTLEDAWSLNRFDGYPSDCNLLLLLLCVLNKREIFA